MRILGIDPGTHRTGFGVVDRGPDGVRWVDHGVITTDPKRPLPERLHVIHHGVVDLAHRWRPHTLALEKCFVGRNIQSALKLGHTRGAIIVACVSAEMDVQEYTPGQIKSAVTGNGRADKHQVAEMVRIILGLQKAAPEDASDALAAAICYAHGPGALAAAAPRGRRAW